MKNKKQKGPKVLLLDIETSPIISYVWGLFDQNVSLNQIKTDWHLLSWSAKWLESEDKKTVYGPTRDIMYKDQRGKANIEDDKFLLMSMWKLMDEADILITQNGISFDAKKLNARFILNGMKPPSPYKHIDTLRIARKNFAFTSNKLEFMTNKLCTKFKKLTHKKFSGFELWKQCLADNKEAWKEMELYNKYDVLSLEELYHKLQPWDKTVNFDLYNDNESLTCNCGSKTFHRRGFSYTASGKYQQFRCMECGKWHTSKTNQFSKEKRKSLKR